MSDELAQIHDCLVPPDERGPGRAYQRVQELLAEVKSLQARVPDDRLQTAIDTFIDGVEHGVSLALRRIRQGDPVDEVESDCKAIAALVREAHTFVGPSGR